MQDLPALIPIATSLYQQCLHDMVQNATTFGIQPEYHFTLLDFMDNEGNHVNGDLTQATSISYDACTRVCPVTSTYPDVDWQKVLEQFSAWVLPGLAILCQLPYGSYNSWDDLVAMLLTVGSPAFAAYSLAITALNGRWITKKFEGIHFGASQYALICLRSLQQTALKGDMPHDILSSLVVLPQNDDFWHHLAKNLHEQASTWTVPTAGSVTWVIVAYLLSVAVSFLQFPDISSLSSGPGMGGAWISLIAIVTGWLIISPKSNARRNADCIERANQNAWVAPCAMTSNDTLAGQLIVSQRGLGRAIEVLEDDPDVDKSLLHDQMCSQPIYNYARLHTWRDVALNVYQFYSNASSRAGTQHTVHGGHFQNHLPSSVLDPNRLGTVDQVIAYCSNDRNAKVNMEGTGKMKDFAVACLAALTLQWCTLGSAIITSLYTPPTGLGCRSLEYIIFGVVSDIVWGLFIISSWLSHKATANRHLDVEDSSPTIGHITIVGPSSESLNSQSHRQSRFPGGPMTQTNNVWRHGSSESSESFEMSPLVSPLAGSGDGLIGNIDADSAQEPSPTNEKRARQIRRRASARFFSIFFRRLAKIIGCLNGIYLIGYSLNQGLNGFDNCFCNSNALKLGVDRAVVVVYITRNIEAGIMMQGVIASVALSVGCTVAFIGTVWLLIHPTDTFTRTNLLNRNSPR